jgi:hypothetical protein
MEKEVKVESVLTPGFLIGLIIFSAILSFISINAVMFASYFSHYFNFGNNWWGIAPGPFFIMLLLVFLRVLPPIKRMDIRQIHVLIATSMMVSLTSSFRYPLSAIFQHMPIRFNDPWMTRLGSYVPEFWIPSAKVIEPGFVGGNPVPWGDWIPALAFWILWGWGAYFLGASLAMIMRRRFIEEERMTFPVAAALSEFLGFWQKTEGPVASGEEKPRYSRIRMVTIGLIIGIITVLPWILRLSFAWFPSLYGWEALPWIGHAGVLSLEHAIPALHYALPFAATYASFNPIWVAIGLFMSLDVLFSAWVAWIIFGIIIPVALVNAGFYPSPGPWYSGDKYWIIGHTYPYNAVGFFDIGMVYFGLSIWPLIFGWRYLREVGRSIIKPKPGEAEREGLTYRTMFLLLIASMVLIGALALVSGTGVASVPALLIFAILAVLAITRIHGEAVSFMDSFQHFHAANLYWTVFPGWTDDMVNQSYYTTMVLGHSLFGRDFVNNPGGTTVYAFNSYKLQLQSRTWVRDLFIAASLGAVVSVAVALPTLINIGYTAGIQKTPGGNTAYWWTWWIIPSQMPSGAIMRPQAPYWPQALVGFLATGALMFLRMRFAWFPLNVVGIAIGATTAQWFQGHGAGLLVSWIIKSILLRTVGSRVYDRYVIPFTAGFLGGWMFGLLIGTILSVVKFFFPW